MAEKTVIIALADGFEEIEAVTPADILKRIGCKVIFAGLNGTTVTGAHGFRFVADCVLAEKDGMDCDVFVLPGGLPGTTNLRDDKRITNILRARDAAGKICAAICAAPSVFEFAGIVHGRTITGYPGCEPLSGSDNCHFTGKVAERSENLVTAKGPGAGFAFGAAIAGALGYSDQTINKLLAGMMFQS